MIIPHLVWDRTCPHLRARNTPLQVYLMPQFLIIKSNFKNTRRVQILCTLNWLFQDGSEVESF